jgi:hypothetical protein
MALENLSRDRLTGAPHQADTVDWTGGNRQPIRLTHFGGDKKFVAHGLPIRIRSSIVQFSIRSKQGGVAEICSHIVGTRASQAQNCLRDGRYA